jgi:photosystem II stability/assembly factor-like uncharacterized protein
MKTFKKILTLSMLLFMTVSFSGCLNLSKKSAPEYEKNEHQGIFKTINGGRNWEHKVEIEESENLLDKIKIASMAMDPKNNSILYLGTRQNGLYKSTNGADSWKKIIDEDKVLSENATVYDIAVENENSNIVYIATLNNNRGELLKSEDGGKSWASPYIISEEGKQVNSVEIDSNYKNIIYIGTEQGGFIKSEDKGNNWLAINWFKTGVKDFAVDFQNNNGTVIRTAEKILKTVDGGNNWEELNKTMKTTLKMKVDIAKISSMTIDNKNPLVIYITYLNLILVTRDGGYTWEKMNTITPAFTALGTIPQVKQIGMIDDIIYYGAGNVLYKSENKGITWSNYDIPIRGDVRYTVSDYKDSQIIYVGAFYDPPAKKKKSPFLPY